MLNYCYWNEATEESAPPGMIALSNTSGWNKQGTRLLYNVLQYCDIQQTTHVQEVTDGGPG